MRSARLCGKRKPERGQARLPDPELAIVESLSSLEGHSTKLHRVRRVVSQVGKVGLPPLFDSRESQFGN